MKNIARVTEYFRTSHNVNKNWMGESRHYSFQNAFFPIVPDCAGERMRLRECYLKYMNKPPEMYALSSPSVSDWPFREFENLLQRMAKRILQIYS